MTALVLMMLVIGVLMGAVEGSAQTEPLALAFDGELDSRFGAGGIAPTIDSARTSALQSDGKIVVVGSKLARHNVDGSLDQTFGVNGIVQYPGRAVAVQQDGRIVVAGSTLARFNAVAPPFRFRHGRHRDSGWTANGWR